MPGCEVEGEKNAPRGLKSKGQRLSLHYLWLCIYSRLCTFLHASPANSCLTFKPQLKALGSFP